MESNSSLRDLILITHEEYISIKRQEKTPDAREKQKQHLLSKFAEATQTNFGPIEENQFKTIKTAKELPEDSIVAQLNLSSRYHSGDSSTSNTVETKQSYKNPSDQVLSNLLQSGVTGGKVERSRQNLKKIEDCARTTIDETNQTINLDQQDTGVSVESFSQHCKSIRNNCLRNFSPWLKFSEFHNFCWQTPTRDRQAIKISIKFA